MDIITQLNKKLSAYKSPKVNWLTKRPLLLTTFGTVCALATFCMLMVGLLSWKDYVASSFFLFMLTFIVSLCVCPIISFGVFAWFEKMGCPKQKKVIEKYTNAIVTGFSEDDFKDVKIKLLKILNNEPYTPVCFLDEMIRSKYCFDKQRKKEQLQEQQKKEKEAVIVEKEPLDLTVLIEQIEKDKNESLLETEISFQQWRKSISKM